MKDNIKIATILPYKENYTFSKAQAAAIWVCDFFKYSDFKNTNFIFGNTKIQIILQKIILILRLIILNPNSQVLLMNIVKTLLKKQKTLTLILLKFIIDHLFLIISKIK